ncbi:MAG TPA: hypothetical protein VHG90_13785 [Acidimicrobiales bacterium]|nr:hypothetical protein [Acidimicrobiales bacterium]
MAPPVDPSRRARRGTLAVVLAATLLGCTGDGAAADRERVEAATMRAEDLTPEWRASPPDTSVESEGDASRFAQCLGRPEPKTVRTATMASPRFELGDGSRASSTAQTVKEVAIATDDFAALDGNRAPGCLRQRLQAELDRQSTPGNAPQRIVVQRLTGLDVGPRTAAFRAVITYPSGDAYLDVVNVQKDKLELQATFFNRVSPFPPDFERSVVAKMLARV